MKAIIAALLILTAASPAMADRDSRRTMSKEAKVAKCIGDYGRKHSDRCVEIVLPNAVGRQAISDYRWRRIYCADPLARNEPECRRGRR